MLSLSSTERKVLYCFFAVVLLGSALRSRIQKHTVSEAASDLTREATSSVYPVNLNRATQNQLQTIPGVGPVLAQRIIVYRNNNGPFMAISELLNVNGIGVKKLKIIKSHVVLNQAIE